MSERVLIQVKRGRDNQPIYILPNDPNIDVWFFTAAPPMPRATFDAMVGRAARAMSKRIYGNDAEWNLWCPQAAAALRAALPGLVVEGDE